MVSRKHWSGVTLIGKGISATHLVSQQLGKDASGAPNVDRDRVVLVPKQHLGGPVTPTSDLLGHFTEGKVLDI